MRKDESNSFDPIMAWDNWSLPFSDMFFSKKIELFKIYYIVNTPDFIHKKIKCHLLKDNCSKFLKSHFGSKLGE